MNLDNVAGADILSFHVPLVFGGRYPTWHMANGKMLDRLSPKQFIINCARGPVVDNPGLKSALLKRKIGGAVLDVWEGEPRIDYDLLELVDIGTPHIAGSGVDGKIKATEMVRDELCRFYGIPSMNSQRLFYPKSRIIHPLKVNSTQDVISSVLEQAYDISQDDDKLRALKEMGADRAAEGFHGLRNEYPLRLEFRYFIVSLTKQHWNLAGTFAELGFKTSISTGGNAV